MTLIKHRARTFRCFLAIAALTLLSMSAYAAVQIDATVNVDRPSASTTIQSPAFSTASANELLLAFVTGDYLSGANTQVSSISSAGLTWQLVVRTNTQFGTSEIWRAFSPSPLTNVTVTATLSQAIVSSMTARWYPTATTLSGGRILVTAGWQTSEHTNAGIPEIYNPETNSWTQLTNANNPFETYPFIFLLPNGRFIHVGGSEYATDTDVLDLNTQSWSVLDSRILDGGSAVMYLPNKIMKAGSAADSQMTGPSSNTTFVLDLTQPNPAGSRLLRWLTHALL